MSCVAGARRRRQVVVVRGASTGVEAARREIAGGDTTPRDGGEWRSLLGS
jgi:hypothetical protein